MKPTESELEILQVLWDAGPATVKDVHQQLAQNRNIVYTTTLKTMQNMDDKKLLEREKQGKSHLYRPLVTKQQTQEQIIDRLMETVFKGSAARLVMNILGNSKSSPKDLEDIKKYLENLEGGKS
jgi:predicted transcriptional regulator